MGTIQYADVSVEFECEKCGETEACNVSEAIYNGPPICVKCDVGEEMEISRCYIGDES